MKWADLTATGGQLSRPPTGSSMAAYGHFPMAADMPASRLDRLFGLSAEQPRLKRTGPQ